jgi:hypothetical protein
VADPLVGLGVTDPMLAESAAEDLVVADSEAVVDLEGSVVFFLVLIDYKFNFFK